MREKLRSMIRDFYSKCGNDCGGTLHIVLDDCNIETHHIIWCLNNTIKKENDEDARQIAYLLLSLPEGERLKIVEDEDY